MKYALLSALILGVTTMVSPGYAQFSSSSDSCSSLCVKLDLGSSTNSDSSSSSVFSTSSSSYGSNNLRWQLGITWRPNASEGLVAESERVRRQLEDNRSLMIALTEAIAQNKTEMAHGLAILLAPRLGYGDPRKLLADLKEGSMNIGSAQIDIRKGSNNLAPALIQNQPGVTLVAPAPVQNQPGSNSVTPAASGSPAAIIEIR
jgi:hypothetical protein